MKGAYGKVNIYDNVAFKRTTMYDDAKDVTMGCNISEAALGLTSCKNMDHVINFRNARCIDNNITITMDKGSKTLHDYITTTSYISRLENIGGVVCGLIIGLNALHTRGLAHCDLKPINIIIDEEEVVRPTIIDLGSVRFVERSRHGENSGIICTYAFAAPEALEADARPTFEQDAYSLGVIIYFYIYHVFPVFGISVAETREEALKIHKTRDRLPLLKQKEVPSWIYDAMVGLLQTDPDKRLRICDLYDEIIGDEARKHDLIIDRALPTNHRDRDADIDTLFDISWSLGSFPLAASIRDRSDAEGIEELEACAFLAHMTLYPDDTSMTRPSESVLSIIIDRLNFELYSDTVEWILWLEYGVYRPDPLLLRDAIKAAGGDTMGAVLIYLELTRN